MVRKKKKTARVRLFKLGGAEVKGNTSKSKKKLNIWSSNIQRQKANLVEKWPTTDEHQETRVRKMKFLNSVIWLSVKSSKDFHKLLMSLKEGCHPILLKISFRRMEVFSRKKTIFSELDNFCKNENFLNFAKDPQSGNRWKEDNFMKCCHLILILHQICPLYRFWKKIIFSFKKKHFF